MLSGKWDGRLHADCNLCRLLIVTWMAHVHVLLPLHGMFTMHCSIDAFILKRLPLFLPWEIESTLPLLAQQRRYRVSMRFTAQCFMGGSD